MDAKPLNLNDLYPDRYIFCSRLNGEKVEIKKAGGTRFDEIVLWFIVDSRGV